MEFEFEHEPWVQTNSNPSDCSCISPTHSFCHVMIMHHIVHCIDCVSFCVAGICPLSIDVTPTMSSMTPMKNNTIFRSVNDHNVGTSSIERGQAPTNKEETQSMQCTIWCMIMTWQYECVGLMQLQPEGFELIWTKDSNTNSSYGFI